MYLVDELKVTSHPRYQRHNGKPVLSVWGMGLNENAHPPANAAEALELIEWFKSMAPEPYRVTYMGGTPSRGGPSPTTAHKEPEWADVYGDGRGAALDGGRYDALLDRASKAGVKRSFDQASRRGESPSDLPAGRISRIFLAESEAGRARPNQIPRHRGEFLWRQAYNAKVAGATVLKIAMFDEVDEGTAVFEARRAGRRPGSRLLADAGCRRSRLSDRLVSEARQRIPRMFHGEFQISVQSYQPCRAARRTGLSRILCAFLSASGSSAVNGAPRHSLMPGSSSPLPHIHRSTENRVRCSDKSTVYDPAPTGVARSHGSRARASGLPPHDSRSRL